MSRDFNDPFDSSDAQDECEQQGRQSEDDASANPEKKSSSSPSSSNNTSVELAANQDADQGFAAIFDHDNSTDSKASDAPVFSDNDPKKIVDDIAAFKAELEQMQWSGEISAEEVEALLARFPFLQIGQVDAEASGAHEACCIDSPNGWTVMDYHVAMSSSPGKHFLFTDMAQDDERDDAGEAGGEGGVPKGSGTIVKQAFDTAAFMVALAHERGWSAIYIIDGHPSMTWAAWVAAQEYGMTVLNHEPSAEDKKRLDRLQRDSGTLQKLRLNIRRRR